MMKFSSFLPLAFSLLQVALATQRNSILPIVQSPSGIYVGNASIGGLDQFLGIPFAEPPVGDLRFANPVPLTELDPKKPILATAYGKGCSQDSIYGLYNGLGEDCLTINVIRPSVQSKEPLPVMVWIYGGGNVNGQSIFYNGTALVQHSISISKPVIYVAMNYRLGGFGWMISPDFNAAGISNVGLKDQRLALEWVHTNIASFGGDVDQLIIFGESAGATDSWAQLHYAKVKNETGKYFGGIITESGAPGSPMFPTALTPESGEESYEAILAAVNCINTTDSIACLRAVPYDTLAPQLTNYTSTYYTIDDDWFSSNIISLLEDDSMASIPVIHGANLDEGAVFLPDAYIPASDNGTFDWPNRSALVDTIAPILDNNTTLAEDIISVYFALNATELGYGYDGDATAPFDYWVAVAVYSDLYMHLGRRAYLKKASTNNATWGYYFTQTPPPATLDLDYEYPGEPLAWQERVGTYHGSELPYVFGEVTNVEGATVGDGNLTATMMTAWINFAYYFNPNGPEDKEIAHDLYWPKYNETTTGDIMYLRDEGSLKPGARQDIQRQAVYDAWNAALVALSMTPIY